jgi:hypothetical protein
MPRLRISCAELPPRRSASREVIYGAIAVVIPAKTRRCNTTATPAAFCPQIVPKPI